MSVKLSNFLHGLAVYGAAVLTQASTGSVSLAFLEGLAPGVVATAISTFLNPKDAAQVETALSATAADVAAKEQPHVPASSTQLPS